MTVRELLARTSSRELTEWIEFEKLNGPLGPERADFHAALIASTLANVHRGKGKPPAKISDFLPQWGQPRQSWQEQKDIARQLNRALGGTEV